MNESAKSRTSQKLLKYCVSFPHHVGTGFFLTARDIATAAHVVSEIPVGATINVRYLGKTHGAEVIRKAPENIQDKYAFPDIAHLRLQYDLGKALEVDYTDLSVNMQCLLFGFPDKLEHGEHRPVSLDGLRYVSEGENPEGRWGFRGQEMVKGFSGAPVVSLVSGKCVGIVTLGPDGGRREGGYLTPVSYFVQAIPELDKWQPKPSVILPPGSTFIEQAPNGSVLALAQELGVAGTGVQQLASEKFEVVKDDVSAGQLTRALARVDDEIASDRFRYEDPDTQAKYLRQAISIRLMLVRDPEIVEEHLKALQGLQADIRYEILRSRQILPTQGPVAARRLIEGYSIEAVRYRAAMRLVDNDATSALAELVAVEDGYKGDAELHRLKSLAHLVQQNPRAAKTEAAKALAIAPEEMHNLLTSGVVHFYSCVPDSLIPNAMEAPPEPPPQMLLKLGKAELEEVALATGEFDKVLGSVEAMHPFRPSAEIWKLASLAINPNLRDEAGKYATQLIYRSKPNDSAVRWCEKYDLPVDLEPWRVRVEERITSGNAERDELLSLAWLYQERESLEEALRVVEVVPKSDDIWMDTPRRIYAAQTLADLKRYDEALEALEPATTVPLKSIRGTVIELRDAGGVAQALQSRDAGDSLLNLLHQCKLANQAGEFEFVLASQQRLLRDLPCAESYIVVLRALFNLKRFNDWLALYDDVRDLSLVSRDINIRRMHAITLWNTDNRNEAVREARELFDEKPSVTGADVYGRMLFYSSDMGSLAKLVMVVRDLPELSAEGALKFAIWLQDDYPTEAAALWDRAKEIGVPDELISGALTVAYRVGRSQEAASFMPRMTELASENAAGISAKSYEDVVALSQELAQRNQRINDLYRTGTIPVHVLASSLRFPLFLSHYAYLDGNLDREWQQKAAIYVRHGKRVLEALPENIGTLWIDVTSLFVASFLEILPLLEGSATAIGVSDDLAPLLHEMKASIAISQPENVATLKEAVELIASSKVRTNDVEDGFTWAKDAGRSYVTFLPPHDVKSGPTAFDKVMEGNSLNLRRLADVLREASKLGRWDHDAALQRLGTEGQRDAIGGGEVLGRSLLVDAAVLEMIIDSGMLAALLASSGEISVSVSDAKYLRDRLAGEEQKTKTSANLQKVIDHARNMIASGAWRFASSELPAQDGAVRAVSGIVEKAASEDYILVDDRFLNRWPKTDRGAPIGSVADMIFGLFKAGRISADEYYRILDKARRGSLFFIPITADELHYHIGNASRVDGKVGSAELTTIRRYCASALRQPGLAIVPVGNDERAFVYSLDSALKTVADWSIGAGRTDVTSLIFDDFAAPDITALSESLRNETFELGRLTTICYRLNS